LRISWCGDKMLVFIESFWGNKIITGKKCTENELRNKFKKALKITQTAEFTALFCRMFQFDELPLDEDIHVDYIMDLDTLLVYKPRYSHDIL